MGDGFNLLPLPPLDGSAVVGLFLPESLAAPVRRLASHNTLSIVGLVIAWQVFPLFADPLFSLLLRVVHPSIPYYGE